MNNLLFTFIDIFLQAIAFAIVGKVIVSWAGMFAPNAKIVQQIDELLSQVTEPILAPLRRVVPSLGMFDLTPMIALFLIIIIRSRVVPALLG